MTAPRVVAIIAAYNEADIIAAALEHLERQGVLVYFMDHNSTDGTLEIVRPFRDRNVIGIESFPGDSGFPDDDATRFAWKNILRRKELLAASLDADWFMHCDADEFRESPWGDLGLAEAIGLVDQLGFNAIDFELFDFLPVTHDPVTDLSSLSYFKPADPWNRPQVKCWKKCVRVVLSESGGHDATFEERRIFPIRFISRHYPLRGPDHARRKILAERLPRLVPEETNEGWHIQYNQQSPDLLVPCDVARLRLYVSALERARLPVIAYLEESEKARQALGNAERAFENVKGALDSERRAFDADRREWTARCEALEREKRACAERLDTLEADLGTLREQYADAETLGRDLERQRRAAELQRGAAESRCTDLETELAQARADAEQFIRETKRRIEDYEAAAALAAGRIREYQESEFWKATAPFRALLDLLKRFSR